MPYNQAFKLYKDANKVRYAYLKANNTKSGLERKIDEINIATPFFISDILEVDFGVETVTTANTITANFDITFSDVPTVIATTTDNVKLSVTSTTDTATFSASEQYTGTLYWIAVNKKTDPISVRKVAIALDSGVEDLSSTTKTISFTTNKFVGLGNPIILVSANANANIYITNVSETSFVINTSEDFTGKIYWTAFVIRKL